MSDERIINPGLLNPIDEDDIISPGEIVGGDSIVLFSTSPVYPPSQTSTLAYPIGLIQGLGINSGRTIRPVYQVGDEDPLLISSIGAKSLSMSSVITEESNSIRALYKFMIEMRDEIFAAGEITELQKNVLARYADMEIPEGLSRDLMRIPFGLIITFFSGNGEPIQMVHLGHCMLSSDDSQVEAGSRGVSESNMIMWQKTSYITG